MLIFIDQSTLKNRRWINVDITLTEVMVLFQRWWFAGRKLGLNSSFNISLKTIILLIFINTIRKAPIIGYSEVASFSRFSHGLCPGISWNF